jgi:hypothetical protein
MQTREEKSKAAWQGVKDVIYDTVKDLNGTPSGHLYAHLMGMMSLDVYSKMVAELKREGRIKESGYFLTAI